MKYRNLYLITIGFIILGLGIALLNRGGSGTFFIFPFFFVGDLAPVLVIPMLFVVMMFFWRINKNWMEDARFSEDQEQRPAYLRVGSSCQFCGNPLPENASFCSSCGNTVERDFGDNESF